MGEKTSAASGRVYLKSEGLVGAVPAQAGSRGVLLQPCCLQAVRTTSREAVKHSVEAPGETSSPSPSPWEHQGSPGWACWELSWFA